MVIRSPWPGVVPPAGSLCEAVLGHANALGDKPAIIEGDTGRTLTYRELHDASGRVAAALTRTGLQPGKPLALALPNCLEFAIAFYGALRAGAWVTTMSPLGTPQEMEHQIHDAGAQFLITVPERAALASAVDRAFVVGGNWSDLVDAEGVPPDVSVQANDLAVLPYSSGTTGRPKGVMLTHGNIVTNMRQFYAADGFAAGDVIVNMMPVYHVAGLNIALSAMLGIGGTVVLMRRFDLEAWLALNERYRATMLMIPPPVVLAVTKSPLWDRFRLDTIRRAGCGAAPLGADSQKAFEDRTGVPLRQIWGISEGSAIVAVDPAGNSRRKYGSCGYLVAGLEARVVDPASLHDVVAGATGEIWLRGPNLMRGYWKQPQATEETLVGDGWMRTGDIGYFDSDGCAFLVDRMKEFIKYNALQVAPAELEDLIQTHPAVLDAAVVGAPDELCGEIPMAFVVLKAGAALDAAELMRYVAERVAPHKKVRAVEFIEQIPKSPTGKILRRLLKDRARGHAAEA